MKATGISRSSFSNMVNNPYANISTDNVDKLCNFLSVGPSQFYDYSPWRFTYDFEPFGKSSDEAGRLVVIMKNGNIERAFSLNFYIEADPSFGSVKKHDITIWAEDPEGADDTFISVYNESSPLFQHEIEKELNQAVVTVLQISDHSGKFDKLKNNDLIVQFEYNHGPDPIIQNEYLYHRNKPLKNKLEKNYQGEVVPFFTQIGTPILQTLYYSD